MFKEQVNIINNKMDSNIWIDGKENDMFMQIDMETFESGESFFEESFDSPFENDINDMNDINADIPHREKVTYKILSVPTIRTNIKPVDQIDPTIFFTKKELCWYKMIDKFFRKCHPDRINKMVDIIDGCSNISLRVLDWFVTRYSKRGIDIIQQDGEALDIHINYKAQLKSYKKRYFDPFRRRRKFNYVCQVGDEYVILHTTIGQLNFFRWAINYEIIDYVNIHLLDITSAMNVANKEDKRKKELKKEIKKESKQTLCPDNSSTSSFSNSNISGISSSKSESISGSNNSKKVFIQAGRSVSNEIELILKFD